MSHALRFAFLAIAALIVVDGDTIKAPYGPTYRILGYDTPEIHGARCDAEYRLGMKAKRRLEELVARRDVRVLESGRADRYGRMLAHVTVDGRDLAEVMIGEGLARPYHGERRAGWCGGGARSFR